MSDDYLDNLPFADFTTDTKHFDDWLAGKQEAYEEKIVKVLLGHFGQSEKIKELRQEAQQVTGSKAVTCFWFHEAFPDFPIRLCAKDIGYVHQITVADLYKRFTTTPIYKAFMAARDDIPAEFAHMSWGLVFNWPGLGNMIVHNSSWVPSGTRFMREIGKSQVVYLDTLAAFLERISGTWKP